MAGPLFNESVAERLQFLITELREMRRLHLSTDNRLAALVEFITEDAIVKRTATRVLLTKDDDSRLMDPFDELSDEELQQRFELEEGLASIAMARAQRTFAEIAKRKDKA